MLQRYWLLQTTLFLSTAATSIRAHITIPKHLSRYSLLRHHRFASNMAWLCTGETNEELVENMRMGGLIKSEVIAEVCNYSNTRG